MFETSLSANPRNLFIFDFLRDIDPRIRIITTLSFAITLVAVKSFSALFFGLSLSIIFLILSSLPIKATLLKMITMDSFVVFMLATLPFTIAGDQAFSVFDYSASWQGLERAFRIALRANAIVLMMLSLLSSLEPITFGHALYRLKLPSSLVQLLLFTIRYIEVIHQEYLRLRLSMKARCFKPKNSRHTYISFGYLVGMMLIRAMDRSERILDAMKCRGFSGRLLILDQLESSKKDYAFLIFFIILLIILFWIG